MDKAFRVWLLKGRTADRRGRRTSGGPRASPASVTGASAQGGAAGEGGGRKEEDGFGQSRPGPAPLSRPPPRAPRPRGRPRPPERVPGAQLFPERPPPPATGPGRGRGTRGPQGWGRRGPDPGRAGEVTGRDEDEDGVRAERSAALTVLLPRAARAVSTGGRGRRGDGAAASGATPRSRARGVGAAAPQHPRPPAYCPRVSARSRRPASRRLRPRRRKWRPGVPPPARAPPRPTMPRAP